ncbi:Rap1a/Tai family immunity protein [Achromobacter sp.]|uniref:Rap1a/Tai family immunity protein n=1 Tax=Achromobacter sp. TaxID=134375 RepID=UPI0028A9E8E4|nr:Rap1a/Tai family immunity protein [Achromobacter sp.]
MFKLARLLIVLSCLGIPKPAIAETKLLRPLPDSQSLIIGNNNLTAGEFFAAYMSSNMVERRYAEMYLLGVLDATEGLAWCGYSNVKTVSLDEIVYEGLKEATSAQLRRRAALVITDILETSLPCQHKRK